MAAKRTAQIAAKEEAEYHANRKQKNLGILHEQRRIELAEAKNEIKRGIESRNIAK